SYHVGFVTGDRWGGEFVREPFREHGIRYELCELPKSDLYREFLPALNSGKAELLDNPRLVAQLCALERKVARSGRDSIDHPPGGHDDLVNAVSGALVLAANNSGMEIWQRIGELAGDLPPGPGWPCSPSGIPFRG